jgi:hypothetical protein
VYVQDASRFALHSGRDILTSIDVSSALRMKNLQVLFPPHFPFVHLQAMLDARSSFDVLRSSVIYKLVP